MDQKKIGKFISNCRKERNMTQAQLAEKLQVTDKTVSRWENGNYMPDVSLLQPLSNELKISVNELLSGEKITKEQYQEKLEENIINAMEYSNEKVERVKKNGILLCMLFSVLVLASSLTVFPRESSWSSIFSIFAILLFAISIGQIFQKIKNYQRIIITIVIFICTF